MVMMMEQVLVGQIVAARVLAKCFVFVVKIRVGVATAAVACTWWSRSGSRRGDRLEQIVSGRLLTRLKLLLRGGHEIALSRVELNVVEIVSTSAAVERRRVGAGCS